MRAFFIASLLSFSFNTSAADLVFKLAKGENVRLLKGDVLEVTEAIRAGATLAIKDGTLPETHLFRNAAGKIERSSNGFFPQVKIIAGDMSPERMRALNSMNLWITVSVVPVQTGKDFQPQVLPAPKADYLQSFEESGKPKFNFSTYFKTRFPKSLNRSIASGDMSERDQKKWHGIMKELAVAADRTVVTKGRYLYMPTSEAKEASIAYETKDEVQDHGAWSIAVKATAPRHGFPNVPCAEFMSEMIRQAYKRAGLDVFEDFNPAEGTHLIWNRTSAVINLTNTLYKAGWIPWELSSFRPPVGAIVAHFKATTPGHVYMAAGFDGRLIIDNGSPTGRQLFNTTDKTIKMMYYGGVFFLPPGIIPKPW